MEIPKIMQMKKRGFIAPILAALGGQGLLVLLLGAGVATAMVALGGVNNFFSALFLIVIGWVLLKEGIRAFGVVDTPAVPVMMTLFSFLCFGFALFLINPAMFHGVGFSFTGIDPVAPAQSYSMFATVPIAESPIGVLDPMFQDLFKLLIVGGFLFVLMGGLKLKIRR